MMKSLDRDHVRELLHADGFTVDDPDASDYGRTIIHTRSASGFGADWDLDAVLKLVDDLDVTWHWSLHGYLFADTPDRVLSGGLTFDAIRRGDS